MAYSWGRWRLLEEAKASTNMDRLTSKLANQQATGLTIGRLQPIRRGLGAQSELYREPGYLRYFTPHQKKEIWAQGVLMSHAIGCRTLGFNAIPTIDSFLVTE
jgi:hypothetical protein